MIRYRNDIDGLRAYAVIAVIIFHLGFLPNGYLGVDVFFVISGYLITSSLYKELTNNSFSIWKFYERRIRRIIPLLLFITTTAFFIGLFVMLPDDLENLAQSVVASNFSANNILMLITSADYWAAKNEYKPLMHTWSLGIEEQYYLIYPFLLLLVSKIRSSFVFHFLILTSLISIVLFLFYGNPASRFYLLQYRFFELSIGGFFAIAFFGKNIFNPFIKYVFSLSALGILVCLFTPGLSNQFLIIATTFLTVMLLTTGGLISERNFISKNVFQNPIAVYIGRISFSLYLWHQLIFAFSRYALYEKITFPNSLILIAITFLLSIFTYHFIENPFRNRKLFSTKKVLTILSVTFLLSTSSAIYIYFIGGVYKDFDAIGLTTEDVKKQGYNMFSSTDNIHIHYNEKIRKLDRPFSNLSKRNILIIGNSYGRDVANIFVESSMNSKNELRYFDINRAKKDENIVERWKDADVIIFAANGFLSKDWIMDIGQVFGFTVDLQKVYVFGTKDYGYSNGIHYNKMSSISDFSNYYANMRDGTLEEDKLLQTEWGSNYISLISPLIDKEGKIRIFDDNGKFISQDTVHLTKAGAIFYSRILSKKIEMLTKV
jgi:peptidoglycan/LPS O-acetylase OafA/YrhL